MIKQVFKVFLMIIISLVVLSTIWWFWPARTPKIKSKNSIAKIDYIQIGGIEQCVLIRGHNTNNPVLLFLHGGPGMPMMYLANKFQGPLEKDFTVVQWDRRGAGKTYTKNIPSTESMNVRQILDDAYELIDTLRHRYHQNKIILIGHSFGTYLGSIMVTERPELFSVYISIGQVVDSENARVYQDKFIREKAKLAKRSGIIADINKPNQPNLEKWLFEFGGELKNSKSFFPLVWTGIFAPEYTLPEILKVAEGSSFSSSNMKYNVLSNSIYDNIKEYNTPVYFMVGKFDYTTPHDLISEYYELIKAPKKDIIYFKNSAHFPFFEQPTKFCTETKRLLLNLNELEIENQ
jgi:pimeloyl-ACP methyl ester carboxylesterase